MQDLVRRIPVSEGLIRAAVLLARMTRPTDAEAPAFVKEYVDWGAGPRASQYLVLGAKARAAMAGRPMADLDDVQAVAPVGAAASAASPTSRPRRQTGAARTWWRSWLPDRAGAAWRSGGRLSTQTKTPGQLPGRSCSCW